MHQIKSISLPELQRLTKDTKLLIFGASAVGELLLQICQEAKINVISFLDNNSGLAGKERYGLPIYSAIEVIERFGDIPILISAADIGDIVAQLKGLGCTQLFAGGPFVREIDYAAYPLSVSSDFIAYTATTCALCHDAYLKAESIFLRSVDIVITERCSLKCRDCSNLMQYYEQPKNGDFDEIKSSIDSLCSIVDGINEFRVIGGEPFMNKEIGLILDLLIAESRVRQIVIYTNGTIIPRHELIARISSPKVLMLVTDYGPLSPRMEQLIELMDTHRIAYYRRPAENWTDCATITKHNRSKEEHKQVFNDCCCKNLFTIMNGKLFRCPFSANADRLHAVPDLTADYVNLLSTQSTSELKEAVKNLIFNKKTLDICDYCKGRPLSAPQITPAIQTKEPLVYVKRR